MRTIAVISGKGGVGKTTISSAIGAQMSSHMKKSVLLVDANVTTPHMLHHLGMEHMPRTLNHVIKGQSDIRDAIYSHPSGLKVLPSSMSMRDLEGIDMHNLSSVMERIYDRFYGKIDFAIIDSPPGFGREAMAAIRSCKEALLVASPNTPSVMDVVRCRHVCDDLGIRVLGTVVNMSGMDRTELKKEDVEMITGTEVLAAVPYDKNVARALSAGSPVTVFKSRSRASRSIAGLARLIL